MDLTQAIGCIVQLVFLEVILSVDNAAVLGAMVAHLPESDPIPWPRALRGVGRTWNAILGGQRAAALKIGLLGAYVGRGSMLLLAGLITRSPWIKVLGALYLIYLAVDHFGDMHGEDADDDGLPDAVPSASNFWRTVIAVELADLAFSVDNVVAAVAVSPNLWIILLGVAIGIFAMRYAATLFTRLVAWEPGLESAAYVLLLLIAGDMLAATVLHQDHGMPESLRFVLSMAVLGLTLLLGRVPALRGVKKVFRPIIRVCVWIKSGYTALLDMVRGGGSANAAERGRDE